MYDAILILGGSYIDENTLPKWVESRLDKAITLNEETNSYIVLSRGSTHKPVIRDKNGHSVDECTVMADYMIKKGIISNKIYKEAWSLDTIGNAYAALTLHVIPKNMRKIVIITSDFHMPRTKCIFEKVFSLFPLDLFTLKFIDTPSDFSHSQRELISLEKWKKKCNYIHTLFDLHEFIFTKHNAYSCEKNEEENDLYQEDKKRYCIN